MQLPGGTSAWRPAERASLTCSPVSRAATQRLPCARTRLVVSSPRWRNTRGRGQRDDVGGAAVQPEGVNPAWNGPRAAAHPGAEGDANASVPRDRSANAARAWI